MGLFNKKKGKKVPFMGPWSYQTAGNMKLIYENAMLKMPFVLEKVLESHGKDEDSTDTTLFSDLILEVIDKTARIAFENGKEMERQSRDMGPYRGAYSPMWSSSLVYSRPKNIDEKSEDIEEAINEQVDNLITDAELKIEEMRKRYGL
jgi:hypothetical protein